MRGSKVIEWSVCDAAWLWLIWFQADHISTFHATRDRISEDAGEKRMDFSWGLSFATLERRKRWTKMEHYRPPHVTVVLYRWKDRQAMPIKVIIPKRRYQNHLKSSISTSSWTAEEDRELLKLHDLYGNKWSIIA